MSTKHRYSAAAKRRRQQKLMRHRIACLIVSAGIIVGSVHTLNQSTQIDKLNQQVTALTTRNQELGAALQQSNDKLRLFVDDTEVRGAEPTYYRIPLSEDLQLYTYNKCIEYGIPDCYELVLAMMWQESNYTANFISSNKYGIMQINSCNQSWLVDLLGPIDFLDARDNINAGVYILSKLLIKYGSVHKALMAYNMGEHGASLNWQTGNYTSGYSRGVVAKREAIETTRSAAN